MAEENPAPKDFGFGEDEAMLRDLARRFLDEKLPVETLRRCVAEAPEPIYDEGQRPRWDEALWKEIVDLGWAGLAVGEEDGGAEMSLAGIAGVVEEVGRHALPSPLIPTLCATLVLRAALNHVLACAFRFDPDQPFHTAVCGRAVRADRSQPFVFTAVASMAGWHLHGG